MNKKTVLKISMLMIIGSIFGAVISFGLIELNEAGAMSYGSIISEFIFDNTILLQAFLILLIYFPAVYLLMKGKKTLKNIDSVSDQEMDQIEKIGSKYLDLVLPVNGVFMILTFMLFGMAFDNTTNSGLLVVSIFLISTIATSVLEIVTIKFVQKMDERLKGDPISLRFAKDFLESCDEAQKLRIYKSGYKAFQFTKNASLVLLIIAIMFNLTLKTGAIPIVLTGIFLLMHIISYGYFEYKNQK